MTERYDYLVIGSGIAGLSFALKVAEHGTVCIVSKSELVQTNTQYAQGGIAAVTQISDSYQKHIQDTLEAGVYINKPEVVEMVVTEAPQHILELVELGANFDRQPDGNYDLAKEGGHSEHRILHHKDSTGAEIQRALTESVQKHPRIRVYEHHFAVDLITQHHQGFPVTRYMRDIVCFGAYVLDLNTNQISTVLAKSTLLATGGIGNIYQTTTNPSIATGDGIAMVYRAKGEVSDMEFVQFHPTAFYNPTERPSFLISEAMRGFGAVLRTLDGKTFMHKYDKRESLAPRDIVARAIDTEMKQRGDSHVYLDATHLDAEALKAHFPMIYQKCLQAGVDITRDYIPVAPAAHYLCGGISVDLHGHSSISNLYAAGETTATGLHGANRLASNSLLEAVVYAGRAAKKAIERTPHLSWAENIPDWNDEGTTLLEEMILITQEFKELQQIMTNYVGIVRSNVRLQRAMDRLELLYRETEDIYTRSTLSKELCELRNAINVGYLIIKMARRRRESRGLHYTIDYPMLNESLSHPHTNLA